jgi:hypothetical protein
MSVSDNLIVPPLCKGRGTAFQGYEGGGGIATRIKKRLRDCYMMAMVGLQLKYESD